MKEMETGAGVYRYTSSASVRAPSHMCSTHGRAPNLPGARTHFDPWTSEQDNNLLCSATATSVRAHFGRCFDGEGEPRSSETTQSAPFRPSAGPPIDASNARNCPGPSLPPAWKRLMQAPKLECCSEHEQTPPCSSAQHHRPVTWGGGGGDAAAARIAG